MFLPCQCCGDGGDGGGGGGGRLPSVGQCNFSRSSTGKTARMDTDIKDMPRGFYISGPPVDNVKLLHRDYGGETMFVEHVNPSSPCQGYESVISFFSLNDATGTVHTGAISGSYIRNQIRIFPLYDTWAGWRSFQQNFESIDDVPENFATKNVNGLIFVLKNNNPQTPTVSGSAFQDDEILGLVLPPIDPETGRYDWPTIKGYVLYIQSYANGQVVDDNPILDDRHGEIYRTHYMYGEIIFSRYLLVDTWDEVLSGSHEGVTWQAENLYEGDGSGVFYSRDTNPDPNLPTQPHPGGPYYHGRTPIYWVHVGNSNLGYSASNAATYRLGYHPFLPKAQEYITVENQYAPNPVDHNHESQILQSFALKIPDLSGNGLHALQEYMLALAAGSYTMPFGLVNRATVIGDTNACCTRHGYSSRVNFCMGKSYESASTAHKTDAAKFAYDLMDYATPQYGAGFDANGVAWYTPSNMPDTSLDSCTAKFARTGYIKMSGFYSFVKTGSVQGRNFGDTPPEVRPAVLLGFQVASDYLLLAQGQWFSIRQPLFYMTSSQLGSDGFRGVHYAPQGINRLITISNDQRQSEYGLNADITVDCQLFLVTGYERRGTFEVPIFSEPISFDAQFGPSNPLP